MSEDLISRKAAYKAFSDYLNKYFVGEISSQTELNIGEIASVIKSTPAAFDKEKVLEELKSNMSSVQGISGQAVTFAFSDGYYNGIKDAIEIVEKGGIE